MTNGLYRALSPKARGRMKRNIEQAVKMTLVGAEIQALKMEDRPKQSSGEEV